MKRRYVLRWFAKWIFVACGMWLMGLGGYFAFARPPLLPEDLRFLESNTSQLNQFVPHLAAWLRNVFTVMGGFIAGCGVVLVVVAVRAIPQRLQGTGIALGVAGLFTVGTMTWINFLLDSDFKWLLLAPAVAWLLGLACYAAGK